MNLLARWVGVTSLVGVAGIVSSACGSDGAAGVGGGGAGLGVGGAVGGAAAAGLGGDGPAALGVGGAGVGGAGVGGAGVAGAGVAGAGLGGGNAKSYCETMRGRERSCGILSEGKTACADFYDAAEPCEIGCMVRATCADIIEYYCTTTTAALGACYASCVGLAPVECGDGSKISGYARCNGVEDCADGRDEVACSASNSGYKCRNVDQFIAFEKLCDGTEDCSDGSDENLECPKYTCKVNGVETQLPFYTSCDGTADCDGASDEPADCAIRSCP